MKTISYSLLSIKLMQNLSSIHTVLRIISENAERPKDIYNWQNTSDRIKQYKENHIFLRRKLLL